LKAGGQNVLKKFYNEFEHIAYFDNEGKNVGDKNVVKK